MNKILISAIACLLVCTLQSTGQSSLSIYFASDSDKLTPQEKRRIDRFLLQSDQVPERVDLRGYCDSTGSREYNILLSRRRALSVWNYLHKKKPEVHKGSLEAFGIAFPAASNETADGRQLNRRVEMVLHYPAVQEPSPEKESLKDTVAEKPPGDEAPLNPEKVLHDDRFVEINERDTTLTLRNMNFVGGQYIFLPEAFPTLTHLMEIMLQFPQLQIDIEGHICCSFDSSGFELDLSINRARAVRDFLISGGIDSSRMTWKGFGGTRHLVPEYSEADRSRNRRVEIKMLNQPIGTEQFRPIPFRKLSFSEPVPAHADSSFDIPVFFNPRFPLMDRASRLRLDSLAQWMQQHPDYRLLYSATVSSQSSTAGFTESQVKLPLYFLLSRNISPSRLGFAGYTAEVSDREAELRMQYYGKLSPSVLHIYLLKQQPG